MLQRLAVHVSNYSAGNLLVTIASLVSFPVLTRLLSVDEYGVMNLIGTALSLGFGLAKLGVQHAALRFYSEIRAGKRPVTMQSYESTVVYGMGSIGLAAALVFAAVAALVPAAWWNDARIAPLMMLSAGLIFIRVVDSSLVNQLRAQEESRALTIYNVVRRYSNLALLLGVLFFVSRDLWGFYGATLVGEIVATVLLAAWMWRRTAAPRPSQFSPELYRAMLAFGLPMIGIEIASVVLQMGDRYVIQSMLGAEPLGIYSAAYNLCDYVRTVFIASFATAVLPMYLRIWEEKGRDETLAFLGRFMHVYMMASALVIAGLSAVAGELIAVLASAKYLQGAPLAPWVIGGMALDGLVMVVGAGLYIEKRTKSVALLMGLCAALNIGLNLWWIPLWGLTGAAAATLASYAALLASAMVLGRRRLPVPLPLGPALKFGAIGLATYFAVDAIRVGGNFTTLVVRGIACLLVYAALVLLFDTQARDMVSGAWRKWRQPSGARLIGTEQA
ncbi:lipopolysaccharide biosynthesis protein [Caldimonas tepidiphila]|uniref:lipopolysaccharide biosynthesis protein n=1 Tax=Caldimonas tepidiphila TaxID=2315841 RepID=UPI000E5B6F19|nr:oligosaccharide flippase family protein [Caldimonas tepidiphila]